MRMSDILSPVSCLTDDNQILLIEKNNTRGRIVLTEESLSDKYTSSSIFECDFTIGGMDKLVYDKHKCDGERLYQIINNVMGNRKFCTYSSFKLKGVLGCCGMVILTAAYFPIPGEEVAKKFNGVSPYFMVVLNVATVLKYGFLQITVNNATHARQMRKYGFREIHKFRNPKTKNNITVMGIEPKATVINQNK